MDNTAKSQHISVGKPYALAFCIVGAVWSERLGAGPRRTRHAGSTPVTAFTLAGWQSGLLRQTVNLVTVLVPPSIRPNRIPAVNRNLPCR